MSATSSALPPLPLPPEAAALGGPEFRSWLAAASAEVARHRSQPLAGAVAVKAFVAIGANRRDINKVGSLLIDVLTASGGGLCIGPLFALRSHGGRRPAAGRTQRGEVPRDSALR